MMSQQECFDLLTVFGSFPQPLHDGFFLDPLDPVNGCQAVPFGQQR
jgi:hypothetical protein